MLAYTLGIMGEARKEKDLYGKDYFTGSFHGAVGTFSKKDLKRSINWFTGWINFLDKYVSLKNGDHKSALEIGCSIGGAANILAKNGFAVTATDISEYAIKRAKKLSPQITFFINDIEKSLPDKKQYNVVLGFEVIEHLHDPELGIRNMYKALKKGGYVICSTQYPYPFAFEEPTHISVKHPKDWKKIFSKAGFKNVKTMRATYIPFLYRYHSFFSKGFAVAVGKKWINSTVYIIGQK